MRAEKRVRDYSDFIATELCLPKKQVRKVLVKFWKNIADRIKQNYEIRLDDYFSIHLNSEAKFRFYQQLKTKK
jgi:nucleoid DNA-binding protein